MKQKCVFAIGFTVTFLLGGCFSPTSYHSTGFTGGFSDTQLSPDTYRIFFQGNAFTSSERAQDFAMLHAADVCMKNGFTCFAILSENDSNKAYVNSSSGNTHTSYKPETFLLIQGYKSKPDGISTFDADFLQTSLKQKYHVK